MTRTSWSYVLLTVLVMAGGCATSDMTRRVAWGQEALGYFETWAGAYTANDTYGVLDFYTLDATVEDRTSDYRETAPSVATVLQGNTDQLTRQMLDVHVGADQALVLVAWPDYTVEYGAVLANLAGGYLSSETILLDGASLQNSLRADPATVARYETAFGNLAAGWTSGDPEQLATLYARDAVIHDALSGVEVTGQAAILEMAAGHRQAWATARIPAQEDGGPVQDAALFLDPVEYGADPQRAVGVFEITGEDDCTFRMAVHWRFAEDVIVEERRYPEVESFRRCDSSSLVDGWWTGLDPPGPRDQVETGVIATPAGNSISVRNGSPRLEGLVKWGLNQYAAAGLSEPRMDTVTFEPTRQCEGVAGRVITAGTARDLVLCIDESDPCPGPGNCTEMALGARVGMLHELAHAWMLDELDDATRGRVLELSGRERWIDDGVPWKDRGVEYAAQVMAWGMADEVIRLVELGDPPCEETISVFEVLTGIIMPTERCGR